VFERFFGGTEDVRLEAEEEPAEVRTDTADGRIGSGGFEVCDAVFVIIGDVIKGS
jgi:hypothetical protein